MKIVMFGMPAAGKGTQSQLLAKLYQIPHISPGEIFRNEMANETELGKKIDKVMKSGGLVDDDTTIEILKPHLKKDFILDGFPRNKYQAEWFDSFCETEDITIDAYILLDINEEVSRKRIVKRSQEINRPEDANEVSLKTRYDTFYTDTIQAIDHFERRLIKLIGTMDIRVIYTLIKGLVNGR